MKLAIDPNMKPKYLFNSSTVLAEEYTNNCKVKKGHRIEVQPSFELPDKSRWTELWLRIVVPKKSFQGNLQELQDEDYWREIGELHYIWCPSDAVHVSHHFLAITLLHSLCTQFLFNSI